MLKTSLLVFAVVLSACVTEEAAPWERGTVMVSAVQADDPTGEVATNWLIALKQANQRWRAAIETEPGECYPFMTTDVADSTTREVTLVPRAEWTRETGDGYWSYEGGILIKGDDPTKQQNKLMHEIGHALTGSGHTESPDSVLYGNSTAIEPTAEDIALVRSIWCE